MHAPFKSRRKHGLYLLVVMKQVHDNWQAARILAGGSQQARLILALFDQGQGNNSVM